MGFIGNYYSTIIRIWQLIAVNRHYYIHSENVICPDKRYRTFILSKNSEHLIIISLKLRFEQPQMVAWLPMEESALKLLGLSFLNCMPSVRTYTCFSVCHKIKESTTMLFVILECFGLYFTMYHNHLNKLFFMCPSWVGHMPLMHKLGVCKMLCH